MRWLRFQTLLSRWQSLTAWDLFCLGCSTLIFSPLLGALASISASARMWSVGGTGRVGAACLFERLSLWILGLITLGLLFSTAWAEHPGEAGLGLFHFIPYFFVFVGLQRLLISPQRLHTVAWIFVLTALPVSLIGLGQLFWGWAGPIRLAPLIDWELTPGGNPTQRMASVFAYANVLADYWVMIWALAIGLAGEQIQQLRSSKSNSFASDSARSSAIASQEEQSWCWHGFFHRPQAALGLLAVILVATAMGLILCNSRNAWAIAILIGLLYALYWRWHWILASFSAIVVFAAGAAFAPPPAQDPLRKIVPRFIWARLNDQLYPDRPTEELRSTQWQFAWEMVIQKPWTGWGLRSFAGLYENQSGLQLGHPHNFYLMMAAETGLITTLLLLGFVGWTLALSVQRLLQVPYRSFTQQMQVMYGMAFLSTCLFHLLDIPLFDLRINLLGWILLAGLAGQARESNV